MGKKASLWEKAQEEGCTGADTGWQLSIARYTPLDGGHLHRPVRLLCWHPDLLLLGCVSGTLLLPQVCQGGLLGNTFSLENTGRTHFNVWHFKTFRIQVDLWLIPDSCLQHIASKHHMVWALSPPWASQLYEQTMFRTAVPVRGKPRRLMLTDGV